MTRRIYISCDFSERKLEEINSLCLFLQQTNCLWEFAPGEGWAFSYRLIEEAIDRCDTFVAAVGLCHSCSTWLAHEVTYALTLQKARMEPRPRVLALRLSSYDQPNFVEKLPVEWFDDSQHHLLLEDLPD